MYQRYGVGHQPVVNIGRRKKRAAQFFQHFMPTSIFSNVQTDPAVAPVYQPEKVYQPVSVPIRSYQAYGVPVYPALFPAYPSDVGYSHQLNSFLDRKADTETTATSLDNPQRLEVPAVQTPDTVEDTTSVQADTVPVQTEIIDSKVIL